MADKVAFELVSPERLLASLQADMVVVPGEQGDFGVLPEHAPLVSLLRPGVITVYENDKAGEQMFVEGGFAEVNPNGLIVLAEAAAPLSEIEGDAARQQLSNAEEDLAEARDVSEPEKARLERQLAIARARVEAVENKAH